MVWTVVRFLVEETVEVVPVTWINKEQNMCFWPKNHSYIAKFIKKAMLPQPEWQSFEIKLLTRNEYSSFDQANKKAFKAKYVSDLSSEEEYSQKRLTKKPRRYQDSSDETDDDDDDKTFCDLNIPGAAVTIPPPPDILTGKFSFDY